MSQSVLTNLDLNQNQIENAAVHNLSEAPTNPVKGQQYFNTVDNVLYYYDGTNWVKLSDNIDLSGLATKEELAGYLPLSGGTINGELKVVGPKSTIRTYSGDETIGYTYLELKAQDENRAEIRLANNSGETLFHQRGASTEIRNSAYNKSLIIKSTLTFDNNKVLDASDKAVANGVASLDSNTKVPVAQLPYTTSMGTSNELLPTQNTVKSYTDSNFIKKTLVNTRYIGNGVNRQETRYGGMNVDTTFRGITITQAPCNVLYRADAKGATITCNYEDIVANLGKRFVDGDFGGHYPKINPSTMFGDKPFIWEITRPTAFGFSDVCKLLICGHNIVWNEAHATNYKLEVATYANNTYTWGTVYEYSGTSIGINGYYKPFSSSLTESSYHQINGIRLTINSSPDTIFTVSEILLYDDRGSYSLAHAFNSVDVGKDTTVYANITIPTDKGSFIGNVTGTASKAIADADGNTISSTYLKTANYYPAQTGSFTTSNWTSSNGKYTYTISLTKASPSASIVLYDSNNKQVFPEDVTLTKSSGNVTAITLTVGSDPDCRFAGTYNIIF